MSKNHRIALFVLLGTILGVLFLFPVTKPQVSKEVGALVFSSLFLLSFSALILEHLFTRPTDVVAAGVSILLLLIPSRGLLESWGWWYWALLGYEAFFVLIATIALLLLTDSQGKESKRNRVSAVLKSVSTHLAPGKVQYFWLFVLSLVFFVEERSIPFIAFLLYACGVVLIEPQKLSLVLPKILKNPFPEVGELIGIQGNSSYLIRLHPQGSRPSLAEGDLLEFSYGVEGQAGVTRAVAVERLFLNQEQWIRAMTARAANEQPKSIPALASHRKNAVYRIASRRESSTFEKLVGLVQEGTDVGTLRFRELGETSVGQGDLVQVQLDSGPVVYQVVNANVSTRTLESKNESDGILGEAVQLGQWDSQRMAFERFGWVPRGRTPVEICRELPQPIISENEIVLGHIPGTDFPVVLDREEAISHHTAVLGVTGVGKSVFARKLIRDLASDGLRVIVVDFTREWKAQLSSLGAVTMMDETTAKPLRRAINKIGVETSKFKNQQDPDFIAEQKKILFDGFSGVIEGFLKGDEKVRVFELPDVSNTEGVLEYTQWFFQTLFHIARNSNCFGKRVCVVLEEAHTVIPEWNFVGIADKSSKSLVNNISQIALQGRKYGVGFLIIAQRTASVSKTVLTQCNTIIAFQCFDTTSIEFLSNYLPKSVAQSLPSLPFRRAVAVGKAVKGSVPLMFEVPEIIETTEGESGGGEA